MSGKIDRLRTFAAVTRLGSFSAAARATRQSPPVVTRLVAELEAELGAQLLVRTTRKVQATAAGKAFAADCERILADLQAAEEKVRAGQMLVAGDLRVSAPLSFGQAYFGDTISQFRVLHPGVKLLIDLEDRFVDILQEDYDMAIRISEPPKDKSTIWRKIMPVPRLLVAAPGYLERRGRPASPADLRGQDCLGYSHMSGGDGWRLTDARGRREIISPSYSIVCNNGDLLADLAAAGEGIAALPLFIVEARLASGALVDVLPGWQLPETWLTAYYPPYTQLPNKVRVFTEFLEASCLRDATPA